MRHEVQQRDKIHIKVEIVTSGVGRTGESPTATLKRVSDGLWWDGAAWGAVPTDLALAEVDAVDLPGLYRLDMDPADLDMILGSSGYSASITNAAPYTLTENLFIEVTDEVSELPLTASEAQPVPASPVGAMTVQVGTSANLAFVATTSPAVYGRAGAWTVREFLISVGQAAADVHDLIADGFSEPEMIESAVPTSGGASSPTTTSPVFFAAGGPSGEDVYSVIVQSTSGFSAGDYVRAAEKPTGQGHVHEVLDVPDGTHLTVHAFSGHFDIIDGDTVEQVDPTGQYVGVFSLPIDDYLSAADRSAVVRLALEASPSGDGPAWAQSTVVTWQWLLDVDLAGRGYRTA